MRVMIMRLNVNVNHFYKNLIKFKRKYFFYYLTENLIIKIAKFFLKFRVMLINKLKIYQT